VKADGDDISAPDRVSRIVEAWRRNGARAFAVCHSGWMISSRGRWFGRLRQVTSSWPLGAAMAFSPELYRLFPKADDGRLMDDDVYIRRAMMLGEVLEIPDRLVWYRIGVGATTSVWNLRRQIVRCYDCCLKTVAVTRNDLACIRGRIGPERAAWYENVLNGHENFSRAQLTLASSKSFSQRLQALRSMPRCGRFGVTAYLRFAQLMPRPIGDALLFCYVLARNVFWKLQRPIVLPPAYPLAIPTTLNYN
jgi:hypothetical protein